MTLTHPTDTPDIAEVAFDLYRDIHKGIRSELFAVTCEAGRADPSSTEDRSAVADHLGRVVSMLVSHAEHEDMGIDPALDAHLPDLAQQVALEHHALESRMELLTELADAASTADAATQRRRTHQLYLALSSFTADYLRHQDLEERIVMPALQSAIGVDAVVAIHGLIIGSIPPPELMQTLAVMFPAMNVEDRVELLSGMQMSAPPEAFGAVVGLVRSVLDPDEAGAVTQRVGAA
ncbi:MAG: hemerythrin domain-containing protein [Acidimicrobiales bacterium]